MNKIPFYRQFLHNLILGKRHSYCLSFFLFLFIQNDILSAQPSFAESAKEPVRYTGSQQTDKYYYHGGLRYATGTHHYQIFRANRIQAPEGGIVGWTYSHAPMLAYWNNKFYVQYLSNLKEEHNPPARTLIITSEDGRNWSDPVVVFPIYPLPESKKVNVQFRVMQKKVGTALFEFEVHDRSGKRPMRLRFDPDWISFDRGAAEPRPVRTQMGQWVKVFLALDCLSQTYNVTINGVLVKQNLAFAEKVESLERMVFRTGPWRGDVRLFILDGEPGNPGLYQEDLPGADFKVAESVFLIDDIQTSQ